MIGQGSYYIIWGLWIFLARENYRYFHEVYADFWLLTGFGIVMLLIGVVMAVGGYRHRPNVEIRLLCMALPAGFLATNIASFVEVLFPPMYYLDVGLEALILILWGLVLARERS